MSILLIAGSPTQTSRSAALLDNVGGKLSQHRLPVDRLAVRELDAQALLHADFQHPDVIDAALRVQNAQVLVIATPVYKAAYAGALKVWLDLLPQTALKGKTVLPLATGGSPHHMLAMDYALRPVLQSLGAKHILPGIYAIDSQIQLHADGTASTAPELQSRIDDAVQLLLTESLQRSSAEALFPEIPFSQVRCSV